MPTIPLHPPPPPPLAAAHPNSSDPLPQLLQTPSGLAILELQGTINMPPINLSSSESTTDTDPDVFQSTSIGKLVFPDYVPSPDSAENNTAWMKRVYLYVGQHQRLTGEVKKLAKPMAVIRRRDVRNGDTGSGDWEGEPGVRSGGGDGEELEIVDIVRWKVVFSSRPEPVGS